MALLLLTLCSCSRKKTEAPAQASIRAETPADNSEWIEEDDDEVEELSSLDTFKNGIQKLNFQMNAQDEQNQQESEPVFADEEYTAEEERLGTEVLSFLEDEANFTSPIIESSDTLEQQQQTDTVPEVESVEKRLLDAYNRLKVMEFETEVFIPVTKEDSSVLVHYSNKAAVRLFYDNLYRLTKKEYWKMESVENAKLTGTEKYSYDDDSKKPYEKIIEKEDAVFVSKLNENGLVIKTEKYAINEGSLSNETRSLSNETRSLSLSKGPLQTTTWTYDDKNRITSETVIAGKLTQKQVFNYDKTDGKVESAKVKGRDDNLQNESSEEELKDLPPDYEYYENGVLITKTEYIKKGVYSTTIWFDKVNSVRTDYENYVKVRDVYFTNGVERRVKNYE